MKKKCICTNENSFRQRRKFLSSMIMAGVVYSAPALLTINEAQAGSYPYSIFTKKLLLEQK